MDFKKSSHRGLKRFLYSFIYAGNGIKHAIRHEQNIKIQLIIGLVVTLLAFALNIEKLEKLILFIVIGTVISLEFVNTAIERIVDLVTPNYHPIAKVAKDVSAAAVLIFSIFAIIIGIVIFYVPVIDVIKHLYK